jgi:SP family facilitated glucose transporter-like MFS transporter 12
MSPNTITSSERIPTFVLKATAAASLGGILFGYDMGVISAALPQLIETFNLGEGQQEMVVSFLYIGCFIGASVGGFLCDKHGRKRMIIVTDVVFIVGATVLYAASTFRTVLFGRIIIGCAVAISGIADVAYLHEISPSQYRGAIVSCNEACISLGFLISYLVGYFVSLYIPNDGWRDMFAFGSIIAALQLIGMIMMPESPVWLEQNGEIDAAEVVLNQIYGTRARASTSTSNEEVESNDTNKGDTEPYSSLTIEHPLPQIENTPRNFSMQTIRTFYRQIIIAVFLCTMQSWCGHTNILNFAPEIFAQFGFNSEKQVLICTLLVGVVSEINTQDRSWSDNPNHTTLTINFF